MSTPSKKRPRPGQFRAYCALRRVVREKKMTVEDRNLAIALDLKPEFSSEHRGKVYRFPTCSPVGQRFSTDDADLFDAHMLEQHGRKAAPRSSRVYQADALVVLLTLSQARRGWVGPKLTAEGAPFEPSGLEVGAVVEWDEVGQRRTGQVWSAGPTPGEVFVVPHEPADPREVVLLSQVGAAHVRINTWLAGQFHGPSLLRGTADGAA